MNPNAVTNETALGDQEAMRCIRVFAQILASYDLYPTELRLACEVLAETFCRNRSSARLDFVRISDQIGTREKRCIAALHSLLDLHLVFWDSATGIVTPNPDPVNLSRARSLRARLETDDSSDELSLDGERLLDASLASNSRSAAIKLPDDESGQTLNLSEGSSPPTTPIEPKPGAKPAFDVKRYCEEFRAALRSGQGLERFPEAQQNSPPPTTGGGLAKLAPDVQREAKLGPSAGGDLWGEIERYLGPCTPRQLDQWVGWSTQYPQIVRKAFRRALAVADKDKIAAFAARCVRDDLAKLKRSLWPTP